jgi:hypothetical protein
MARKSGFPGVGERIKERLIALGYERNGHPDIMRFCDERRYRSTYFYRWANYGMTPEKETLDRLAADLGVKPWWLLYGPIVDQQPDSAGTKLGRTKPKSAGRGIMSTSGRPLAIARGRRHLTPQRVGARGRAA